jgi:nitroreductase
MHELIEKRWSPRAFSGQPVEKEKLTELFEAARWAASCFNEQPWRFIYAAREEEELFRKLFDSLVERNQQWVKTAPLLILTIARRDFSHNGKPNRHAWHDVGLAMGNFILQATALGLFVHQMAGFSSEKARENLCVPAEYEPVAMVAVGYPGDSRQLPEELRAREGAPRTRKPLAEIVFHGAWQNADGPAGV